MHRNVNNSWSKQQIALQDGRFVEVVDSFLLKQKSRNDSVIDIEISVVVVVSGSEEWSVGATMEPKVKWGFPGIWLRCWWVLVTVGLQMVSLSCIWCVDNCVEDNVVRSRFMSLWNTFSWETRVWNCRVSHENYRMAENGMAVCYWGILFGKIAETLRIRWFSFRGIWNALKFYECSVAGYWKVRMQNMVRWRNDFDWRWGVCAGHLLRWQLPEWRNFYNATSQHDRSLFSVEGELNLASTFAYV